MTEVGRATPEHRRARAAGSAPDRSAARPHRPFWLELGFEAPGSRSDCPEKDCVNDLDSPTDVFCRAHERFLPYATDEPGRLRWFVVNGLRSAVLGAFALSAELNTAIPLDLLGAVLGFVLLLMPLRHYPVTFDFAASLWGAACVIRLVLLIHGVIVRQVVTTSVAVGLALACTWYLGNLCVRYGTADPAFVHGAPPHLAARIEDRSWLRRRTPGRAAGAVAAVAASAPGALLVLAVFTAGPSAWVWHGPHALRGWLLGVALSGALATLFAACVAGFLHGALTVGTAVDPLLEQPDRPRRITASRPSAPARGAGVFSHFAHQMDLAVRRIGTTMANLVRSIAYQFLRAAVRVANWSHRQAVIMARRIGATARCAALILRDAAVTWCAALGHTVRVLVVPIAAVGVAVTLITFGGHELLKYLVVGGAANLGGGVLDVALLAACTCVAWLALCSEPIDRALHSAAHNALRTFEHLVVLTGVGGLVVGLPGTLGHGRIHIGMLTLTLDVLMVSFAAYSYFRDRQHGEPPADPADLTSSVDGARRG
jgi:hypothetical protein